MGKPTVVVFDWDSGKRLKVMRPTQSFQGTVSGLQFHPSGEFLLAVGGGNSDAAWFFKPDSEKPFLDLKLPLDPGKKLVAIRLMGCGPMPS